MSTAESTFDFLDFEIFRAGFTLTMINFTDTFNIITPAKGKFVIRDGT
jgi:hypothetical protein